MLEACTSWIQRCLIQTVRHECSRSKWSWEKTWISQVRNSCFNVRSICFHHHARSLQPIFSQRIVWAEQVLCGLRIWCSLSNYLTLSQIFHRGKWADFFVPGNPGDCARSCRRMLQVYISFYIENSGPPKWIVFFFSFSKLHIYVCMAREKEETSESGSCW